MRTGRRWRMWGAGVLCATVPALCCGPFFPEAVFVRPNRPDAPYARFVAGRVGVPQPGYRVRHLAVAYDYLSGRTLSQAEQKQAVAADALLGSRDDSDAPPPGFAAWLAARTAFGPVDGVDVLTAPGHRSIPGSPYDQFANCLDDAFANAAKTLASRQSAHGAHSAEVVEWVRGQDAVFRNCGDTAASFAPGAYHPATPPAESLPEVLNNAPQWLAEDRAYQRAAAQFYALQYTDALNGFRAVATDHNSPWSALAEYLTARTMIRQATIGDAAVEEDAKATQLQRDQANRGEVAGLTQAQTMLRRMRVEPRMQPLRPAIEHLLDWIALRVDPQAQALVLSGRLNGPEDANFGQDLIDLSFVVDRAPFTRAHPGEALAVDVQPGKALWAWMSAVSLKDEDAALPIWRANHNSAWLLAALMAAKPGEPQNPELLRAAASVPSSDPGYVAITYHRLRLAPASAATRAELERVRPAVESGEGPSAANLFAALDAASAQSLDEWLRMAGRKPSMITDGDGNRDDSDPTPDPKPHEQTCGPALRASDVLLFTPPAAEALNTRMPLTVLVDAAESKGLAPNLQFALAQAAWTRAVLLDRPEIARRMTPLIVDCRSAWKPVLKVYDEAQNPQARHVAALLALMRFASTEPNVRAGAERAEGFATYSEYRDNWWLKTVSATPSAMASFDLQSAGEVSTRDNADQFLLLSDLSFLSADQRAAAHAETLSLMKIPAASEYFASAALSWWRAHPHDPADAELLGEAMRVARNAPRTDATSQSQHALFDALHTAFPQSEWAKRYSSWE